MNFLMDTHIFMWWDGQSVQLPESIHLICRNKTNTLYLSLASVWEMQIKSQLGKLDLRRPLAELVAEQQWTNGLRILPIRLEHIIALGSLPLHHKDPFDRLLIAQAQTENMTLLSVDEDFPRYTVHLQR